MDFCSDLALLSAEVLWAHNASPGDYEHVFSSLSSGSSQLQSANEAGQLGVADPRGRKESARSVRGQRRESVPGPQRKRRTLCRLMFKLLPHTLPPNLVGKCNKSLTQRFCQQYFEGLGCVMDSTSYEMAKGTGQCSPPWPFVETHEYDVHEYLASLFTWSTNNDRVFAASEVKSLIRLSKADGYEFGDLTPLGLCPSEWQVPLVQSQVCCANRASTGRANSTGTLPGVAVSVPEREVPGAKRRRRDVLTPPSPTRPVKSALLDASAKPASAQHASRRGRGTSRSRNKKAAGDDMSAADLVANNDSRLHNSRTEGLPAMLMQQLASQAHLMSPVEAVLLGLAHLQPDDFSAEARQSLLLHVARLCCLPGGPAQLDGADTACGVGAAGGACAALEPAVHAASYCQKAQDEQPCCGVDHYLTVPSLSSSDTDYGAVHVKCEMK